MTPRSTHRWHAAASSWTARIRCRHLTARPTAGPRTNPEHHLCPLATSRPIRRRSRTVRSLARSAYQLTLVALLSCMTSIKERRVVLKKENPAGVGRVFSALVYARARCTARARGAPRRRIHIVGTFYPCSVKPKSGDFRSFCSTHFDATLTQV